MKYFFGMPEKALSVYRADNSGPFQKPYLGSNVPPRNRIDHITHHAFLRALSGPGLEPTSQRFMQILATRLGELPLSTEWTEIRDLRKLFQEITGSSLIQAVFGPLLLRTNPNFVNDLWKFDDVVPWLARAVPSFLMPGPYRIRKRLFNQLKNWYTTARQHFCESSISEDGDGDPFWGSELVRSRQEMLLQVDSHDDDTLASADLGLIWG